MPFKSTLARSAGKPLGVFKERDLSLRGATQSTRVSVVLGEPIEVANSLRFNSGDSAYLNKTPSSSGNRKTFTLSYWIKECGKGSSPYSNPHILWSGTGSSTRGGIVHRGTSTGLEGKLYLFNQVSTSTNCQVWTSALTEDYSVWRHIVLSVDTNQATSTDRVKIYINGVQETLTFSTTPARYLELQININQEHIKS